MRARQITLRAERARQILVLITLLLAKLFHSFGGGDLAGRIAKGYPQEPQEANHVRHLSTVISDHA